MLFGNLAQHLRPGGHLAAECGGQGNVASVAAAVAEVWGSAPVVWNFAGVDETRRAVARAGAGVSIDQLKSLTEDLDAQAIAIDAKLVEASKLPDKPRHKALVELKYRVIETEKLAVRVRELAVDMTKPQVEDADEGNRRIRDKLDALDHARREAYDIGHPLTIREHERGET